MSGGHALHVAMAVMTTSTITTLAARAIKPQAIRPNGPLTTPRRFGGYELLSPTPDTRRFRFGNHPVRLYELERERGSCRLLFSVQMQR